MAKLHTVAVYCALICVVMMAFAAGEEEPTTDDTATTTQQPVSEPPIKLVHVLNPGEREYLSPNLIGLQNIAMTFLPLSMSFINIIDAYREVVNGVRYEILLNAIDTKDNDKEIICELVILEKPWLRTEWGDKVRELRQTNCTGSDGDNPGANDADRHARSKALNDKYQKNMLFDGGKRSELSADEMAKLEAQIMGGSGSGSAKVAFTKQNIETTTTTTTTTAEPETTADPNTTEDLSLASTEPTTSTTKELSDDEKNWLDNIFSIGAFNFEQQQLQQKQQQRELLNEQALIERNEASNYVQPQSETQTTLELLMNANANDDDDDVQQQQRQQQEPETFDYQQQQQAEEVEQQQAAAAAINNLQLSQEPLQRSKRSFMTGGKKELNIDEAEQRLQASLDKLAAGDGPYYRIGKIHSATTQIVSGTLTEVDCDMINAKNEPERCLVKIWSQPWMPNGIEVTFKCADNDLVKARHSRSVEYEEKKTHKKQNYHKLGKVEHYFNKFQLKYQRRYHSTMERQMRFRIFQQNLKLIEDLNRNEMGSAKYGITEFADMTSSEYKMRTGLWQREPGKPSAGRPADIPDIELPKEFDWREKGAVTAVKNQGNCGSCWAFSVTGNIEGINAVKTGQLHEFSEQELLDCDTIDSACGGGLPDNAYKAIQDIGGLEYEDEYPYTAHKDQCTFNKTMAHVKVTDFVDLPKNETAMAQWLIANGPISIGINANAMQFYRGGVSHPWKMLCSKSNLDHGVLIVGYGISEYPNFKKNLPYWIVKNSWGPKWGEQGYYRVYRGENTCGVSEMASSAVLA